jgi:hypothetical protein
MVGALARLPQTVIDGLPLSGCVLIIRHRQFGDNADHAPGNPEFHSLAALKTGTPPDASRHDKFRFVWNDHAHIRSEAPLSNSTSLYTGNVTSSKI